MTQHSRYHDDELGEGWIDCHALASDPKSMEPPKVIRTGFGVFDESMPYGGIPHGSIGLWMGEMKAGKSRLVLALCAGSVFHGARVAYMMGEMSPEEHHERLVAMCTGITPEEVKKGMFPQERAEAAKWLRENFQRVLKFRAVPITLDEITKAARWVGPGGIVVVDSIQKVQLPSAVRQRSDEVEAVMAHIINAANTTGAAFQVLSEISQAPKGRERGEHEWCKHSSAPRQGCDWSRIVHKAEGTVQRIECVDDRRAPGRDFRMVLDERNFMPMLPMYGESRP